ncbi:hypothetical protein BU25DRAFT_416247 [Macroventuria anomochaeta]|uniref:Uncharacterized protein n=1 Tax=Macroventuria anomochaeta TaxID=301207 RepID=A0ACB6RIJ1_9PLEO|nr:uncharacterized protein BU25DRAFT_416247 [Macroventuria anomochaeta]KAF2621220.1 hypothetical protein BU25DRAFT_416247 [Macroventuria anomochaeta]
MRRRVANKHAKDLGSNDHNTDDHDPGTVASCPSRTPHIASINPSNQHITPTGFSSDNNCRLTIFQCQHCTSC